MSSDTAPSRTPDPSAPSAQRDRTHWLYLAVVAAVLLGVLVGFLAPDVGTALEPLGTGFVALIK